MPLLLVDLDNTLVDRDSAFRAAVAAFLAEYGLPEAEVAWAVAVDASGYTPRDVVAAAMADRYGNAVPGTAIRSLLDTGAANRVVLTQPVRAALAEARASGWTLVIVTNGRTVQQEAKLRNTGLDRLVDGLVVSEAVGHKKPSPEIFHLAARLAGLPLDGAWIIGDSPHADIGGASRLGLPSVWISNGHPWSEDAYSPTHTTADVATAIRLATTSAPG